MTVKQQSYPHTVVPDVRDNYTFKANKYLIHKSHEETCDRINDKLGYLFTEQGYPLLSFKKIIYHPYLIFRDSQTPL